MTSCKKTGIHMNRVSRQGSAGLAFELHIGRRRLQPVKSEERASRLRNDRDFGPPGSGAFAFDQTKVYNILYFTGKIGGMRVECSTQRISSRWVAAMRVGTPAT